MSHTSSNSNNVTHSCEGCKPDKHEMNPQVRHAQRACEAAKARQAVVVFIDESGQYAVASYGETDLRPEMNDEAFAQLRDHVEAPALVTWCRERNVRVRFHSNKTVSVFMNGMTRRRKSFFEAVAAMKVASSKPPRSRGRK